MMNSRSKLAGLAMMAASMAAIGENMNFATESTPKKKKLRGGSYANTILTPKQEKIRSANKRAKKARRINRN